MRRPPKGHASGIVGEQRGGEVPAGRRQELEPLVERQRIGAVFGQQRAGGEELPRDGGRGGIAVPADLLAIAADRVDLAVVGDRADGLREPPDRLRVRRVPLVEHRVPDRQPARRSGYSSGSRPPMTRPCRRRFARRPTAPRSRPAGPGGTGGRLEASARDDQAPLERVVGTAVDRPRPRRPRRRSPGRTPVAIGRRPPQAHPVHGTARHPTTDRPPPPKIASTRRPRRFSRARPRGRNSDTTPGRATAASPASSASTDRSSGMATPAPSLIPRPPRMRRDARAPPVPQAPAAAPVRPPPASATNPTPHASCSNRGSTGAR